MVIINTSVQLSIQLNISFSDDHKSQYHVKIVLCLLNCINLADNNQIRQILL